MQILLIQEVNLFCEIRPVETPSQVVLEPLLILSSPLLREHDFPANEVIKQPHIGLDKHGQPPRPHNKIRIHEWQTEMLHHIGNLYK